MFSNIIFKNELFMPKFILSRQVYECPYCKFENDFSTNINNLILKNTLYPTNPTWEDEAQVSDEYIESIFTNYNILKSQKLYGTQMIIRIGAGTITSPLFLE
jgi:hypothetical protein